MLTEFILYSSCCKLLFHLTYTKPSSNNEYYLKYQGAEIWILSNLLQTNNIQKEIRDSNIPPFKLLPNATLSFKAMISEHFSIKLFLIFYKCILKAIWESLVAPWFKIYIHLQFRRQGNMSLIPGSGRLPGEEKGSHSSILAWEISWTEKPGRQQFIGLQELNMTQGLNHHYKSNLSDTLWKILKEMAIPDHLTCLLRNLYAGQEAKVRTGHGKKTGFKQEKEYVKAVYCHPAYLTSMQSTS